MVFKKRFLFYVEKGDGMELAILNSLVCTTEGVYKVERIDVETARKLLKSYQGNWKSYVGHESTANFLSALLKTKIQHSRVTFQHRQYQTALCFKLFERVPEKTYYTEFDLERVDYTFFLMKKID